MTHQKYIGQDKRCIEKARVSRNIFKKFEESYPISADVVLFFNHGQSIAVIDETVIVYPGGFFKERNVCNDYQIDFYPIANPREVNIPIVYPENHLVLRALTGINSDADADLVFYPNEINATVSNTPYESEPLIEVIKEVTDNEPFSIPAGQLKVEIVNVGPIDGFSSTPATINGESLSIGNNIPPFSAILDPVNFKLKTSPAYDIVPNGHIIWYKYSL